MSFLIGVRSSFYQQLCQRRWIWSISEVVHLVGRNPEWNRKIGWTKTPSDYVSILIAQPLDILLTLRSQDDPPFPIDLAQDQASVPFLRFNVVSN